MAVAAAVVGRGRGRTGSPPIKKPSTWADHLPPQVQPVTVFVSGCCPVVEYLFATVPFAHQAGNAAAVAVHGVEQLTRA